MKVFFFSSHSYDRDSFNALPSPDGITFTYYSATLCVQNASIAEGHQAICIFVNDKCDAEVLHILNHYGVKAIFLRCAGYNNVDLKVAKELGIFVARVPGALPA